MHVAADETGQAVGFAVSADVAGIYWLKELSVDPAFGGKGIGSALLDAVVGRARWACHGALGLTTFRDVPFNAPFYARRGFLECDPATVDPDLGGRLVAECPPGVPLSSRILMIRRL